MSVVAFTAPPSGLAPWLDAGIGVLLAGTPRLIKDRLNPGWKAPQKAAGAKAAASKKAATGAT